MHLKTYTMKSMIPLVGLIIALSSSCKTDQPEIQMRENLLAIEEEIKFLSSVAILNCVNPLPKELTIYGGEAEQILEEIIPKIKEIIDHIPYNENSMAIKEIIAEDLIKIEEVAKEFTSFSEEVKNAEIDDSAWGLFQLAMVGEQAKNLVNKYENQRRIFYTHLKQIGRDVEEYIDIFNTKLKNLPEITDVDKRFYERNLTGEENSDLIQKYGDLIVEIADENVIFKRYTTEGGCLEDVRYSLGKEQSFEMLLTKASNLIREK